VDSPAIDLAALQDEAISSLGRLVNISAKQIPAHARGEAPARAAYEYYLAGLGYLRRYDKPGNIDLARDSLENAVNTDPQFALGFACLAQLYLVKYDLDSDPSLLMKAEQYGKRAAELDDQVPATYVALGRVHELTGKHDLAIQELQRAVRLDPRDTKAITALASSYHNAGRDSDAELAYSKSTALRPDDWEGYNKLGNFYEQIGKHAQAVAQFRRAIQLTPDNYILYLDLGNALMNDGDVRLLADAEKALNRSIAIHPTFQAYSGLGMVFQMQHRYREGVVACEKATQINESNYDAWNNLTMAYEWVGDIEKAAHSRMRAINLLRDAIARDPQNSEAQATLAALLAKNGMREEALRRIRISLAASPQSGYVLTEAVDTFELLGERLLALKYFKAALEYVSLDEMKSDPEMQGIIDAANIQAKGLVRETLK
jgi:serine/threonine-protein kinase